MGRMTCLRPMRLLLLAAAAHALAAPKTGAYQRTSSTTKNIISTLTKVVNLQGGRSEADLAPRARQFETLSGAAVKEGLAVDFGNEYLWSGKITPELYDEDCVFTDPTLSFAGLRTFEANLANLDFWIESLVPESRRRVDLFDLALVPGPTDRVRAKWRMLGALRLPWGPVLDLNGTTTYTLGGDGGRISSYDETWEMTAGDALGQLLRPGATTRIKEPPFWPGRATGAAPPAPGVTFGAGAPTFVVLPGFGNDKVDYSEPLGLDEACGLVAALERRGLAVEVVDVARGDWLQVLTKGIFDGDFFISQTAAADSPAFSWYADAVRATLAGVDGDVVLVGHSAGGWLARAACLDAAVAARVAGVVTLGSPHRPPPAGVECATRGVVASVFDAPRTPGVLVTVSSDAVAGGDSAVAADGYGRVCGDAAGVGDGVVPLSAAHLDDADLQITLACSHSINVPGTSDPTDDWYGAERNVDAWLGPLQRLLRSKKAGLPAWAANLLPA